MIGIMSPLIMPPKCAFKGPQECGFWTDFATLFSRISLLTQFGERDHPAPDSEPEHPPFARRSLHEGANVTIARDSQACAHAGLPVMVRANPTALRTPTPCAARRPLSPAARGALCCMACMRQRDSNALSRFLRPGGRMHGRRRIAAS
jgi:hypothetical protein